MLKQISEWLKRRLWLHAHWRERENALLAIGYSEDDIRRLREMSVTTPYSRGEIYAFAEMVGVKYSPKRAMEAIHGARRLNVSPAEVVDLAERLQRERDPEV